MSKHTLFNHLTGCNLKPYACTIGTVLQDFTQIPQQGHKCLKNSPRNACRSSEEYQQVGPEDRKKGSVTQNNKCNVSVLYSYDRVDMINKQKQDSNEEEMKKIIKIS